MAILSKDDFNLSLPQKHVDISDYGANGEVIVRALTASEEAEIYRQSEQGEEYTNILIVAKTAVDEDEKPLFSKKDVEKLSGALVRHLANEALYLSGMIGDDEDKDETGK